VDPPPDDGSPDTAIRSASSAPELLDALRSGRLLVAIVATADEVDASGDEKSSHMSVVSMVSADGRRGLLAFTGLDSLQAWDRDARPVPVSGAAAAEAALDDGCEAIVVDVAGPKRQVVVEADLLDPLEHARSLAEGILDDGSGVQRATVEVVEDRLRIRSREIGQPEIVAALQASTRVLALVPGGIEVQAPQS
jgi:hypothetical protein